MINYLEVLALWMDQPHYLVPILIGLYFLASTIDFLIGTINAGLTTTVKFSTKTAQLGIMRKLVTLAVMILIIPLALMLPEDLGIYSLTVLYIGIVVTEIYSILAHIGIVQDGDKHKNLIGTLFLNFINSILNITTEKKVK